MGVKRTQLPKWTKILISVLMIVHISSSIVFAREPMSESRTDPLETSNSTSPSVEASVGGWHFTIVFPMVWAVTINGEIEGGGERVNIKIPFRDILDKLSFGIMGEVYARKGPWSFVLKVNYMDTESETVTQGLTSPIWGIPIAPSHRVETNLKMAANDLLVRYQVHDNFVLYTGVRHIYNKMDLDIAALGTGLIAVNSTINVADDNLFDWLAGAVFVHWFNDRWGVKINGDFAVAGDNDRDYSLNGLIFYKISKLNNIWAGYRYLSIGNDTDSEAGMFTVDFSQHGPTLGWAFTF